MVGSHDHTALTTGVMKWEMKYLLKRSFARKSPRVSSAPPPPGPASDAGADSIRARALR
ncbi:hypothetical protein AHiyo4_27620 [Arthrobacter sp. Hiyo4]|nr:hypothetical protein AHiyo4_27620 [Arthrobacter sp. Hiyo4]